MSFAYPKRGRRFSIPWLQAVFFMSVLASCATGPSTTALPTLTVKGPAAGPLRVHEANPRYFTDGTGKAVYLTGAHTWGNFQDHGRTNPPPPFDYPAYLDFMRQHNTNFMRLWVLEQSKWQPDGEETYYFPLLYERAGPDKALDGGLKFDVTRWNQTYFDRLRNRVEQAGQRGIYVAIMLFQGWSIEQKESFQAKWHPWLGHPFHRANNINGIDGDLNGDGQGSEVHLLLNRAITELQEAYVRKVIDAVNDLDNVLYEIANESTHGSGGWQTHMIDYIHAYEARKPKQHPVWLTAGWDYNILNDLLHSPAEAIAPGLPAPGAPFAPYRDDPPANDGRKVIISDTDHLWGVGGDRVWVWKSFLRGLNPIYMDPYDEEGEEADRVRDTREDTIRSLGHTLAFADRMDLASMTPDTQACSSGYCLVNPGKEYLVYVPPDTANQPNRTATVDLSGSTKSLQVEWFNPATGKTVRGGTVAGGDRKTFTIPFEGDAVLYLISLEAQGSTS